MKFEDFYLIDHSPYIFPHEKNVKKGLKDFRENRVYIEEALYVLMYL